MYAVIIKQVDELDVIEDIDEIVGVKINNKHHIRLMRNGKLVRSFDTRYKIMSAIWMDQKIK